MYRSALSAVLALVVCSVPAVVAAKGIGCFDVIAAKNSSSTRRVFAARRCQGGGVTWAAILQALVKRRGSLSSVHSPIPGLSGDVAILDGKSHFSIDDEGDAARFCSDDLGLRDSMRDAYALLNRDKAELERAMSEASPLALECLGVDGKTLPLPPSAPLPVLPKAPAAAIGTRIDRMKALLAREPAWCFAADDPERREGVLRFFPSGQVTQTLRNGALLSEGAVVWPREGSGDDRLEIVLRGNQTGRAGAASLLHLSIGPSGRLGETYADTHYTRRDLIPGSICLRAR